MSKLFAKILIAFSSILFLGALIAFFYQQSEYISLFSVIGMISLAIAFNGFKALKGFSYTLWIIVGILLGMIYPENFVSIGGFDMKKVIVPFVQLTMFGMGAQMSFEDFKGVIKMPKGVLTGVFCHFTVMPLVGFTLSKVFNFSPEIAAGVVLIGCVPSAMASNVMSFLAKANLALAVTIGATSTILAPFITPFLMRALGGQYIEIDVIGMMLEIINMIIVPVVAGFIFNLFYANKESKKGKWIQLSSFAIIILITNVVLHYSSNAQFIDSLRNWLVSMSIFYFLPMIVAVILRNSKSITIENISNTLAFLAMMGIIINTIVITASGRDSLMQVGLLLILSCLIHNILGFLIGYNAARIMGLPEQDRRTIAFEVGMQNGGVATGLALQMGKIATVGLASAIFGPLQNLTGSALVNIFKRKKISNSETKDCVQVESLVEKEQ